MDKMIINKISFLIISSIITLSCNKDRNNYDQNSGTDTLEYSVILGRATESSITISTLFTESIEVYFEYSSVSGEYNTTTAKSEAKKDIPVEFLIENLTSNTKYYYRVRYRLSGSNSAWLASPGYSFHTQRSTGTTFTFAIEADPHLDYNSDTAAYALTLTNIAAVNPDFLIDLGDTFMSEKLPPPILQADITGRHLLLRSFFDNICHSVPLYLVLGNHEGELGWRNDGSASSMPVIVANTRKLYYPNPVPDQFYSGNTISEPNVGLRQNYYSWEWGNALFVVLDPFWYSTIKGGWGYTLGKEQYDWFKDVVSKSQAKYKFVFCHNLVGGNGNDERGGAEYADLFEMGGYNTDGTWGFDTNRSGWGKPVHTVMKENNVTAFFHGHDHFYGKQLKDGIIYQEVPQPSNRNITNMSALEYGYVDGEFLPGRGFLLVTVSDQDVKVEYIATYFPAEENALRKNATAINTYTIN
jgi:hypothetical protein